MPRPTEAEFLADRYLVPDGDSPGMTYRQWLAGHIMVEIVGRGQAGMTPDRVAEVAISYADALIARLAPPLPPPPPMPSHPKLDIHGVEIPF